MATSITPEFIQKLRSCLIKCIAEMEREMDEIGNRPEGHHRSHDEMAMDDQHWDELDRKVMKFQKLLTSLDSVPVGQELSEEVRARVAKIQELVDILSTPAVAPTTTSSSSSRAAVTPPLPTVHEETEEERKQRKEEEYEAFGCKCLECLNYESEEEEVQQDDCRYCSGCYYCSGPGSGAGTSWNESGYYD